MARKKKPAEDRWLTRNQLEVLQTIAAHGRRGVYLFYTDLSLATIRSLFKRGLVDTRRRGRIVATWRGKRRLKGPWPTTNAAVGSAVSPGMSASGGSRVDSGASQED